MKIRRPSAWRPSPMFSCNPITPVCLGIDELQQVQGLEHPAIVRERAPKPAMRSPDVIMRSRSYARTLPVCRDPETWSMSSQLARIFSTCTHWRETGCSGP